MADSPPHGRALLAARVVDEGLRPREVAQAQGVSVRTVYKWIRRFREEGHAGLQDRTSCPARSPFATDAATVKQVIERRQQRQTYRQIAQALGIGQSTVARLLKREELNRFAVLSPARSDNRYEHDALWDLLHLDIKKLGRFERPGHRMTGDHQQNTPCAGWEYVHVPSTTTCEWLSAALTLPRRAGVLAWPCSDRALMRQPGIRFTRVLTDSGACYRSRRLQPCAGDCG